MIAGLARPVFLKDREGTFVADLAEGPDGTVSLAEAVVWGVGVLHQRLDAVARITPWE